MTVSPPARLDRNGSAVHFPDAIAYAELHKKIYVSLILSVHLCERCFRSWQSTDQTRVYHRQWSNMGGESYSVVGSIYRSNIDGTKVECVVPAGIILTPKELKYDERYDCLYVGSKNPADAGYYRVDLAPMVHGGVASVTLLHRLPPKGEGAGCTLDKTGELILFVDEQNPGIGVMGREIPPGQSAANRTDVRYIYQTDKPGLPAAHPDADITVADDGSLYWTDVAFLLGKAGGAVRGGDLEGSKDLTVAPACTTTTPSICEVAQKATFGCVRSRRSQTLYFPSTRSHDVCAP